MQTKWKAVTASLCIFLCSALLMGCSEKTQSDDVNLTESYEDKDGKVSFAISYNPNSELLINGTVGKKKVDQYVLELSSFKDDSEQNTLYLEIVDRDDQNVVLRILN